MRSITLFTLKYGWIIGLSIFALSVMSHVMSLVNG